MRSKGGSKEEGVESYIKTNMDTIQVQEGGKKDKEGSYNRKHKGRGETGNHITPAIFINPYVFCLKGNETKVSSTYTIGLELAISPYRPRALVVSYALTTLI